MNVMEQVSKNFQFNDIPIHEVTEDLEDFSPPFPKDIQETQANEIKASFKAKHQKLETQQSLSNQSSVYIPVVYLSIVASGLPPDNNMKILVHNQRMDDNNSNEVLRSLRKRLEMIEESLAERYQEKQLNSQEVFGVQVNEDYL